MRWPGLTDDDPPCDRWLSLVFSEDGGWKVDDGANRSLTAFFHLPSSILSPLADLRERFGQFLPVLPKIPVVPADIYGAADTGMAGLSQFPILSAIGPRVSRFPKLTGSLHPQRDEG
jgi:hypothetical protein